MNRKHKDRLFKALSCIAVGLSGGVLFFLFAVILGNGVPAISIEFLFSASKNFGSEGGIFYQIIGSLLLILFAGLISLPLAVGTAIFKSEYLKNPLLHRLGNALIFGLNGIPSIIFGLFGLIFFVNILGTGISWIVGSVILAFMILPTIMLTTYQAINSVPSIYRECAFALGFEKWKMITRVLLPQGISGAVTGLFMGLARAVGETAPIMFIATAFSGVKVPGSFADPVVALPTHILALAQQATNSQALQNAWGTSLVLLVLVSVFSSLALFSRIKFKTIYHR